ncbi:hypothetical protein RRG08_064244 [Elysia crispata]|uniref:Uncharacterized protein n=1 Tax=Elysia crispata TaxID=231223 RepID=A0AAE1DCA7_9GAST|nr:hypothetical protein RRG08_064244 [Elysia crispata]
MQNVMADRRELTKVSHSLRSSFFGLITHHRSGQDCSTDKPHYEASSQPKHLFQVGSILFRLHDEPGTTRACHHLAEPVLAQRPKLYSTDNNKTREKTKV